MISHNFFYPNIFGRLRYLKKKLSQNINFFCTITILLKVKVEFKGREGKNALNTYHSGFINIWCVHDGSVPDVFAALDKCRRELPISGWLSECHLILGHVVWPSKVTNYSIRIGYSHVTNKWKNPSKIEQFIVEKKKNNSASVLDVLPNESTFSFFSLN